MLFPVENFLFTFIVVQICRMLSILHKSLFNLLPALHMKPSWFFGFWGFFYGFWFLAARNCFLIGM